MHVNIYIYFHLGLLKETLANTQETHKSPSSGVGVDTRPPESWVMRPPNSLLLSHVTLETYSKGFTLTLNFKILNPVDK